MRISAIGSNIYQRTPIQGVKNTNTTGASPSSATSTADRQVERSIYSKGFPNIYFGTNAIQDYIYEKSLVKHSHLIDETDPRAVEDYFENLGVPCSIKQGRTYKDNQVIAYCCFNAAEIMRQLDLPLPDRIDMESFPSIYTLAGCYYAPSWQFPIGTVTFNRDCDWAHLLENSLQEYKNKNTYSSSNHFLHTAIHEFGHNVHNAKLYSKFGCPWPHPKYIYNPGAAGIIQKLHMNIYDDFGNPIKNPYISSDVRNIMQESSTYGSTLLPELFTEEFTRAIINDLDFMSLRLFRDPFPLRNLSPALRQVLNETWEGLIDDGQGLL